MDRLWPTLVIVAIVILVFWGMWWGWRQRSRRDAALVPPHALPEPLGKPLLGLDARYVATTHCGRPMDRVVVAGLAYPGNARVDVFPAGASLAIPGEPLVFLPAGSIEGAGAATWAIDRAVERGGLVCVTWRVREDADPVDTYLRLLAADDQMRLIEALTHISPAGAPAGA